MKVLLSFLIMVSVSFGIVLCAQRAQAEPVAIGVESVVANQAPSASPALANPQPSEPKAVSFLKKVENSIPSEISMWVLMMITALIEFLMRLMPTWKPRSLFILVGSSFGVVGNIFIKVSNVLDKIVQNLKVQK